MKIKIYTAVLVFITIQFCAKESKLINDLGIANLGSVDGKVEELDKTNQSKKLSSGKSFPGKKDFLGKDNAIEQFKLGNIFFPKVEGISRLLEYNINLNYQSKNINVSRQKLLELVAKYGYITSSNSKSYSQSKQFNIGLKVKASRVYQVLQKLDRIGELINERITVNDLTQNLFWQKIVLDRTFIRNHRRSKALIGSVTAKNWQQRESSLTKGEDIQDKAKFEKYKIKDRIEWANISLNINGTQKSLIVEIPVYKNAFISLLNMLLDLSYALVFILPIILLVWLLYRIKFIRDTTRKLFLGISKKG